MTNKLDLIRQKCIEANLALKDVCAAEECVYCNSNNTTRPIRLADVVLAISARTTSFVMAYRAAVIGLLDAENPWNLREDDLSKQSVETIDFLHQLLIS